MEYKTNKIFAYFLHSLKCKNSVCHVATGDCICDDVNIEIAIDQVNDRCHDTNVRLTAAQDDGVHVRFQFALQMKRLITGKEHS